MYVIMGAIGNTGRVIANGLLAQGKKVNVLSRREEAVSGFAARGATMSLGDPVDSKFLSKAFAGAEAVYAMIPTDRTAFDFREYQNEVGQSIANAILAANVKFVVNLSSFGADLSAGTGPILGLHDQERRLNDLAGVRVLHLRPGYFMENLLFEMESIRSMGVIASGIDGNVSFPVISAEDVGSYALKRLLAMDFSGKSSQDLLGPEDLSMSQITYVLGKAIGRGDLMYVQPSPDQLTDGLLAAGYSLDLVRLYSELFESINKGAALAPVERDMESATDTTIYEFAKRFERLYHAG